MIICGVDEVGRGCLAGPVYAAAVVWNENVQNTNLKDSKKLSKKQIHNMSLFIKNNAIDYGIGTASVEEIDEINILNATHLAMHRALDNLKTSIQKIYVDGNSFKNWNNVEFETIIHGDSTIPAISAASILAKFERDEYMKNVHNLYPVYNWFKNVGYGTKEHINAIRTHGKTNIHRQSFIIKNL